MSMQTSADSAAGAPLWACAMVKLAPTSTNRTNLFEDAVADNFVTGQTIGLFNYADGEVADGAAHAGWNLKITGSGGRAGRVQHETLSVLTNAA
jgi:hypothetical protein|tara:strand:- start:116 stop:397 length:282 start_codon:yes stop_codon:yes gene_type:complete